ncbi:8-oxoguanine DNA glycosylase OGG fold protein [Actinomycetospora soli]|uniref:8-oxoguanine DNA glycosylase OGG fold protein n=1 Tax=Actinomycetospora soli TaxID=2893887 RepID=UPI001E499654|nr:hypothetical protein [Actinomycetospora soli]MCD2186615.1 hypothetical protein [Actinomycetospora soli]
MSDVPKPVDDAIEFWREGHRQRAVAWSEKAWEKHFADYSVVESLPNPLGRGDVLEVFAVAQAEATETTVVDAFIASMVWGFGRVGYGAWRTRRILDVADAPARLLAVHAEATAGGGPVGFRAMADHPVQHLGVAFGTKFLFFAVEAAGVKPAAPVLDRVVRSWLADNVGLRLDIWSWRRPQDYELYCEKLTEWGEARGPSVGDVEEAIFEFALRGPGAREAQPRRVENVLEELADLVERSDLSEDKKIELSDCLERLGLLLDEG